MHLDFDLRTPESNTRSDSTWQTERQRERKGEIENREREKREDSGGIREESKSLPCEVPTTNVI